MAEKELLRFKWFWYSSIFVLMLSMMVLLLCDTMTTEAHFWINFGSLIFLVMIQLVVFGVSDDSVGSGFKVIRVPIKYVKFVNAIGPVIATIVVLLLPLRDPLGSVFLHFLFAVAPAYSLSIVMLFRPVVTDAGLFFPWCTMLVSVTVRDYRYKSPTWFALGYVVALISFRCIAEYRAVVIYKERASRPKGDQSV